MEQTTSEIQADITERSRSKIIIIYESRGSIVSQQRHKQLPLLTITIGLLIN
jgi:hypothetical protein